MFAGTIFIQQSVGWDLYTGVIVLLAISAIYTVSGKNCKLYTRTIAGHIYNDITTGKIRYFWLQVLLVYSFSFNSFLKKKTRRSLFMQIARGIGNAYTIVFKTI